MDEALLLNWRATDNNGSWYQATPEIGVEGLAASLTVFS